MAQEGRDEKGKFDMSIFGKELTFQNPLYCEIEFHLPDGSFTKDIRESERMWGIENELKMMDLYGSANR